MNGSDFMNPAALLIEISQTALRVRHGAAGLELPLERLANGKLTPAAREQVVVRLKDFLHRPNWQPRLRAECAIGARGVLLRRLTLPPAAKGEFPQLLRLQIESEFPLAPDELAWGYLPLDAAGRDATDGHQTLIVAAVKKEVVVEYSELLAECGVNPIITLAALARQGICPHRPGDYAVLEIGREDSEWVAFAHDVPVALRILPWGAENLPALDVVTAAIQRLGAGQKLYLIGNTTRQQEIAIQLAKHNEESRAWEPVEFQPGPGLSAAILGLQHNREQKSGRPLLVLQIQETKGGMIFAEPALRPWLTLAGALLFGCLLFPFAEALLMKSHLAKQLSVGKASRGTLATIDRELSFLQYLKQNQSPYLDAMYLLANMAPGGTRIDSLTMNRRGEVSLRGNLRDLQQVVQFRSKLIESGFFSNVTVEEQTPTPDRQKVIVRLTAQWKPASARESLKLGPSAEEMEKIKAAAKEGAAGGFPMMGSPFPMMPGMPSPPPGMAPPPPPAAPGPVPPKAMMIRTNVAVLPPGVPAIVPATGQKKE